VNISASIKVSLFDTERLDGLQRRKRWARDEAGLDKSPARSQDRLY
jgi:hypothetical protein